MKLIKVFLGITIFILSIFSEINLKSNLVFAKDFKFKENNFYKPEVGFYGGQRNFILKVPPKTFNLFLATEASSKSILDLMYIGLTRINPVTSEIVPNLAESWEIKKDKKTYLFKLRKKLQWSDDVPLTANDVVFTFNQIINNPDIPNNYRESLLVNGKFPIVEKLDNLTIRFKTSKPFVPFLRNLNIPIIPEHVFDYLIEKDDNGKLPLWNWGNLETNPLYIVCNGPFELEKYFPEKSVVLSKNKNYWRKDHDDKQLPYFDKVTFDIDPRKDQEYYSFMTKGTDTLWLTESTRLFETLLQSTHDKKGYSVYNLGQSKSNSFVMFNQSKAKDKNNKQLVNPVKSEWFRNLKFRKALAYAIDKKSIAAKVYNGLAVPVNSMIHRQSPFYNHSLRDYSFNLLQAKKLLHEAGFKNNQKGLLFDSKGNPVEIEFITNEDNDLRDRTCRAIKAGWEKLGIKVNYKTRPFSEIMNKIKQTLQWDAIFIGFSGIDPDPHSNKNIWQLDGKMHMFNIGNPSQSTRWKSHETSYQSWEKDISVLAEKAAMEFDFNKRKKLYYKIQELELKHLPFIYTVQPINLIATSDKLGNFFPSINSESNFGVTTWNIDEQFIKPDKKVRFTYVSSN